MENDDKLNKIKEIVGEKKTKFKMIVTEYYLFGKFLILTKKKFNDYKKD